MGKRGCLHFQKLCALFPFRNIVDWIALFIKTEMEKFFVAIDLGATSGRVILAGLSEDRISMEVVHRFPNRLLPLGGNLYWNIYSLYEEILNGLALVGRKGVKIESIGVDTWGVDFVLVGKDGQLLGLPRAYRDPYTDGIPDEVFDIIPRDDVYRRTGIQIMNFNSLFQLYALRKEGSTALENADKLLFIPDAVSYLLTGEKVCEYTILSTSQLMNPYTREIDQELLSAIGVDSSLFPRIVMPGEKIGTLSQEIASRCGLHKVPVIAVAGHDTASAIAAVPAENENFAYLSSGTWSLMGIETKAPVVTDESCALNYTNEGGVDGTVRFLKNITGMWLIEQCRESWARAGKDYSYPEIMRMTVEAVPSAAFIDPDAPEFAAPEDMPSAIVDWCIKHNVPVPGDDAAMMRLIFESLAEKYSKVLDNLRKVADFPVDVLHVIGGGSQNELLNSMTARRCGIPVVAGPVEATALGNVMIQARTAGLVGSLGEMREYISNSIETKTYLP